MNKYSLPEFNLYVPKKLSNLSRRIVEEENNKEFDIDEDKVERSIKKLEIKKKLLRKDIKILSYALEEVEKKKLLNEFFNKTKPYFNKRQSMYFQMKALFFSYYNMYLNQCVFDLLKTVVNNNTRWKDEAKEIREIVKSSKNIESFVDKILNEIEKCENHKQFEEIIEKLFIKIESKILSDKIDDIVIRKIRDGEFYENYYYYEKIMDNYVPWEKYNKVFQEILLSMKDRDHDNLTENEEKWMDFIGEKFGDPNGQMKSKWSRIDEEAKIVFLRWKTLKNITIFFSEISGDPERLEFWKKYVDYFIRVEYFERLDDALLLETKKHVFVEFANGGAAYMYDKKDINIEMITECNKTMGKTRIRDQYLKNRYLSLEREVHISGWQRKFKKRFEEYNYFV